MFYSRKDRGAISVFLVIILVPCMLVASIFVDISRVQLGKAVAESSADLALSTLMSYYDYDLCMYYGLMGSCQDIDKYYDIVAEYYDTALHSRDVEDEEIQLLYQRVMNEYENRFGTSETISDILQIQNITEGAVISSLEEANMYNASILQKQIVEFMKYRAPMEILLGVIGRLGFEEDADTQEIINGVKNSGGVSDVGESDVNNSLVDSKTNFYEAEGKLLKMAFEVYWLTRDYTDTVGQNGMSADKQRQYAEKLVNYREVYHQIHFYLVGNLMNTQGLSGAYERVTIDLDSYSYYDEKNLDIYTRMETPAPAPTATPAPDATPAPAAASTPSPEPPVYYISKERVEKLRNELQVAIDGFKTARDSYVAACRDRSLIAVLPGPEDGQAYAVQWWVQMNNAVNGSGGSLTAKLRESAEALVKAYAKVKAMGGCTPESDVPSDWLDENGVLLEVNGALIEEARRLHGTYLDADIIYDDGDDYLKLVNILERVSRDSQNSIQAANLTVSVDGESLSLPAAIAHMQRELNDMQSTMRLYIGLIDKLIEGMAGGPSRLDLLGTLAGSYASTLEKWSGSADALSTNLAAEHRDEISKVKNFQDEDKDSTAICVEIDRQAVQDMKSRLSDIRSQYQIISDAIAGMQYGNRKLQELLNVETMKECAGTVVQTDSIGLTNEAVRSYADSTFSQLFTPAAGDIAVLHGASETSYNPVMKPDTGQVDTPALYMYLHGKFEDTCRVKVEEQQKEQEEAQGEADELKKEEMGKSRYHGGGENIQSMPDSKGNEFNLGADAVSGLVKIIQNLGNGEFDNIRDNVYTTVYIMNMFSYATYENEGYYSLLDEEQRKKLVLKDSSADGTEYTEAYKEKMGSEDTRKSWLSTSLEDSYNKTLTNRMINKENNVAYLAEVEYILYGESSNEENVRKAYEDIYAIRYVLNLISAFSNFWGTSNATGEVINGVAAFVMEATAGIIPSALTKVILLPILTVFETCRDLDRLEAGFPVELYKSADDWWYGFDNTDIKSVSGFMSGLKGDKANPDKGLYYSDYLTLFVYMGLQSDNPQTSGKMYLQSDNPQTSGKMYLRMADVIQANMCKITKKDGSDGKESYSLTNTQVYFRLKSKLRVEPLMIALPSFEDYIEDPTMKDDWCTFEIEAIRGY